MLAFNCRCLPLRSSALYSRRRSRSSCEPTRPSGAVRLRLRSDGSTDSLMSLPATIAASWCSGLAASGLAASALAASGFGALAGVFDFAAGLPAAAGLASLFRRRRVVVGLEMNDVGPRDRLQHGERDDRAEQEQARGDARSARVGPFRYSTVRNPGLAISAHSVRHRRLSSATKRPAASRRNWRAVGIATRVSWPHCGQYSPSASAPQLRQ